MHLPVPPPPIGEVRDDPAGAMMTLQTFLLRIPGAASPHEAGSSGVPGFHSRKSQKMADIFDSRAVAQHKADERNRIIGANRLLDSDAGPH